MTGGAMTALLEPVRADWVRLQERVSLTGTIRATETIRAGFSPVCRCVLDCDGGELDLLFLGRATIAGLAVGTRCGIEGAVAVHCGRLAVWNPWYQVRP